MSTLYRDGGIQPTSRHASLLVIVTCLVVLSWRPACAQQCVECAANTICMLERNTSCPLHSVSPAGSDSVDDCRCVPGFRRTDVDGEVICKQCPAGVYCMHGAQTPCPINSISEEESDSVLDCICPPGYTGSDGELCTACPAGTFKMDSGAVECTDCPDNTYSSVTARTGVCDDCAEGHVSQVGSVGAAACQSAPGWYTGAAWHHADEQAGVWQCPHGTYQPGVAQTACLRCGDGVEVVPVDWVGGQWMSGYSDAGSVEAASCSECAVNSVTAVNVADANGYYDKQLAHQCVCEPGFSRADATCTVCAAGTHKEAYGDAGCVSCPAHQYPDRDTTPNGDYSVCTVNECYTLGARACAQCPSDSSAQEGSQSKRDCVCNPGYQGHPFTNQDCMPCSAGMYSILLPTDPNQGRACVQCQENTYSETALAATSCVSCTEHASAAEGSDSIDDCTCGAGYQMVNGVCRSCEPGQYSTNNSPCEACPTNTFSSRYSSVACTECPAHSSVAHIAASSVWNCSCNAGYTASGTGDPHCEACPAGTHKAASGFAACVPCEQDTFSAEAATQCVSCGTQSSTTGNTGQDHCVCDAGYEFSSGSCQQCNSGYVKTTDGNVACEACAPGKTSNSLHTTCVECAANMYQPTDAGECLPCRDSSTSNIGSILASDCLCVVGYNPTSPMDLTCTPCTQGTYKTSVSNDNCEACSDGSSTAVGAGSAASDCVACGISHYSISVAASPVSGLRCDSCPSDKYAVAGSHGPGACKCNVGYHGADGDVDCQQCQAGTYKDSVGPAACTQCADGTISTQSGGISVTQCELCPAATYSSYELTEAISCSPCTSHATSDPGSTWGGDCRCNAGFQDATYPASGCVACSAGTFKGNVTPVDSQLDGLTAEEEIQQTRCQACPRDTYSSTSGSTQCLDCAANARHNEQRTACVCKPGHECSSTTSDATPPQGCACEQCRPGTFGDGSGCTRCTSTHYYPEQDTPYASDLCRKCPANSTHPNVTSVVGAYGVAQCTCHPGFSRVNDTCVGCSEGFFCPTEFTQYRCPSNSSSPGTSASNEACRCLPGTYGDAGQGLKCRPCPVNTYCPGGNATAACPLNSTTRGLVGSAARTACDCVAGFYEDPSSRLCVLCPAQTYCSQQVKYQCPLGSSSPKGSTLCRCDPGYRTNSSSMLLTCEACPADAVCSGGADWEQCSAGALNVHDHCECAAGAACSVNASVSCTPPAQCVDCPVNFYCTENVRFACPEHTTAPRGSSLVAQCRCLEGYYREGDTCHPCPLGSYCINQTQYHCADLDAQLTGYAKMAVSRDVCVCASRYFRTLTDDVCRLCPQDYYCLPEQQGDALPNVFPCMLYAYTDGPGSTALSACRCHAGLKFAPEGDVLQCTPCAVGERCAAGHIEPVQCSELNREPNSDHTSCVCLPGFSYEHQPLCQSCAAGTVKPAAGDTSCANCPANTWAVNTTFCAPCPASAYAAAGSSTCTCEFGTVAVGIGALLRCEPCGVGTFFLNGTCQVCPDFSNSTAGAEYVTECQCQRGHVRTPGLSRTNFCVACPANEYEDDGVCLACGAGAVSNNASTSAADCMCQDSLCQHMWRGACRGACEVPPTSCEECGVGKFKHERSTQGNEEDCQACPGSTYQPATGQTECLDCPSTREHALSGQYDINACVCQAGFAPPGASDFEASISDDTLNTPLDDSACHPCVAGGFKDEPGNTVCQACPHGMFASANGSASCTLCEAGVPTPPVGAYHTTSDGSTSVADCKCNAGSELSTDHGCVLCARGSFKSTVGHESCQLCGSTGYANRYGADETGATSDEHCLYCPTYAGRPADVVSGGVLMDSIDQCLCMPGHESWTDTACSACPQYKYKTDYSNDDCVGCAQNYYFVQRNTHCDPCSLDVADCGSDSFWLVHDPAVSGGYCEKPLSVSLAFHDNLRWGRDQADCGCEVGHERDEDTCIECERGKYRESYVPVTCQKCPDAHYQELTGSTHCEECPQNSSYVAGFQTLGSATCACDAGFFWTPTTDSSSPGPYHSPKTGTCVACVPGTFKAHIDITGSEIDVTAANAAECTSCPVNTYSLGAAATCTPCGANMFSGAGADSFDKCYCSAGFGLLPGDGNVCETCPDGTYWGGESESRQACTTCPVNKDSPAGSTVVGDCTCRPGHGKALSANIETACQACVSGKFAPGGANVPCASCGWGTVTEPAAEAHSPEHCMCNAALGVLVHTIQLIHHVDMLIVSDYTRFEQFYILTDAALPVDDRKKAALEALAAENMKVVEDVNLIYASLQPYLVNTDGDRYDVKFHMAAMLTQTLPDNDHGLSYFDTFTEWTVNVMGDTGKTENDPVFGTDEMYTDHNQRLVNLKSYTNISSEAGDALFGLTAYGSTNVEFDGFYHMNVFLSGNSHVNLESNGGSGRNGVALMSSMCHNIVKFRNVQVQCADHTWDCSNILAHELGHTFGMQHSDAYPPGDQNSRTVMWVAYSSRESYELRVFAGEDKCRRDESDCGTDSIHAINSHFSSGNAVCLRTTQT